LFRRKTTIYSIKQTTAYAKLDEELYFAIRSLGANKSTDPAANKRMHFGLPGKIL
jgi:hypothetical protein